MGVGGGSPLVPLSRGGVGVGRGRVRSRENEISAVVSRLIANGPSFVLMLVNFQPSSLRAPHMPSLCFIVGQQACTNTPKLRGRSCGRSHSIPSCVPGVFPRPFPHTARKRRRLCTGAHGGRDWAWCESAFFESTLAHAHSTRRPVPSPLWAQTNKIWSILQYIPPPAVKKIPA